MVSCTRPAVLVPASCNIVANSIVTTLFKTGMGPTMCLLYELSEIPRPVKWFICLIGYW